VEGGHQLDHPITVGLSGQPTWLVLVTASAIPLTMFGDYNMNFRLTKLLLIGLGLLGFLSVVGEAVKGEPRKGKRRRGWVELDSISWRSSRLNTWASVRDR
jgi:hypothetical protein